jgi:hypothetical protein
MKWRRMRLSEYITREGNIRNACIIIGETKEKGKCESPRENNFKMDLTEIQCE